MQSLPPTIDERRARRARRRVVPAAITVAATVGGVMGLVPSASAAPASAVRPAPVIGAAAQGGNVIVWLKDQHSNLNLRTQGALRTKKAHQDQKPLVADIKASGGTHILRLVSVNSVAATVSAAEVAHLRTLSYVAKIVPDGTVTVGDPKTVGPLDKGATVVPDPTDLSAKQTHADGSPDADATNPFPTQNDCGTQDNPLVEPEALGDIDAPAMTNAGLSTEPGHGVVVANDGLSESPNFDLVGNPNFVRPAADGGGSIVESATPGDTVDKTDGEYYGDASSIAAQGTVEYSYGTELPYSGMPTDCYFTLVGDAPGVTLVDTDNINTPESAAGDTNPETLSDAQIVAGIDAAVIKYHTDVINESYGYTNTPGSYATHYAANDAAVASGVTVVVSSGDSGVTGTVSSPATDPLVIAAGATNTLRLNAMAYGFTGWDNDDITPLSSGGTSPNNKVVDLVAPGYGGEAACNPDGSDCPTNTSTEAFGGTSEAAPLIAGAAADVIQAYRDSHNNESPSPALVKQLLVGTAKDIDAPADEQGAGLVDIKAAMAAAAQTTDTTATTVATSGLIPDRTQLDLSGEGGTTTYPTVNVYNPSNATTTVTGTYRQMGPEQQIGDTVTENVSAPDASLPVPADGADAATPVTFDVPSGLDRLDADMIWPDATNGNVLNFVLIDPDGKLAQISYDYGAAKTGGIGSVPDTQHVEVAHPEAGTWTAEIKWGNGRSHLQDPPNTPGSYTGTVSFKASGQNWVTSPGPTVSIGSHRSAAVPVSVTFPDAPGDHPESLQLTSSTSGSTLSLPIARRTLIPSSGGEFDPVFTSSVGRGLGGIETFDITVPAGDPDLGVAMQTADASADNPMSFYLVNPAGTAVTHVVNGRSTSAFTFTAVNGG
ncbi:MAG: S8 family serine peptidase, partial [Williamsia herbipolensis]|nr:S8 family serine peptidase [Williamsia herbipolensis]